MVKTTGGKKAAGKGSEQPITKVTEARTASSARKTSADTATPARKRATTVSAARAAPATAAKAVTPVAKRPGSAGAIDESAREAAAAQDDAAVREAPVSTVQPAVVHQPRVETTAGTANSMTKKLNEVSVDDDATQSEEAATPAPGKGEKAKARDRRAKEKALLKDAFASTQPGTAEELEERRSKLRALIKLGKERGFLTYAEINDHLPDNFAETEAIEGIISTFNDMGVAVYEQAPDAETLLLNDNAPAASSDDEVEEEAEVALSTVDSEFGRTTDPVRMYMREMGTVELLTREGEIEIAKRIEDGLKHMVMAISACPTTIADILAMAERVANDEIRIDELVDGLIDENAQDADGFSEQEAEAIENEDEEAEEDAEEEEEDDDGAAQATANAAQLEALKRMSLEKFASISEWFDKMRRAFEKEGYKSKSYLKAQETIQTELMSIRFTARTVERLCDTLRAQVDEVRQVERQILHTVVDKCGMPRAEFIARFPGNETDLEWSDKIVAEGHSYSAILTRN
ncbi:MAG TPA: RNA polymerase sigma factor region1.1 domain-containing protein, partial [Paraburkholderia sp.]|nr:RNA polymerase sigma factor region1.1 domain-containing protein [Paraburkholderia sp.]